MSFDWTRIRGWEGQTRAVYLTIDENYLKFRHNLGELFLCFSGGGEGIGPKGNLEANQVYSQATLGTWNRPMQVPHHHGPVQTQPPNSEEPGRTTAALPSPTESLVRPCLYLCPTRALSN